MSRFGASRVARALARRVRSVAESRLGLFYLTVNGAELRGTVRVSGRLYVLNHGHLVLHDGVIINSGVHANPVGGSMMTSIVVREGADLEIGSYTGISNAEIYCSKRIRIGARVLVGGGVRIYDTDFHALDPVARQSPQTSAGTSREVRIGDDVFIGAFATVLKGAVIGDGSVIGAASVIAGTIPPNEVWAGNPARFIRAVSKTAR